MAKKNWARKAVLAVSMTAIFATACAAPAEQTVTEAPEKETPVQVAKVTKGALNLQNEIVGTVEPSAAVDIYPKLNGDLQKLNVKKGDNVSKGAVLAEVSASALRDQLELDQSSLELAQKQYKNLYSSGLNGNAVSDQLTQAEISMEQAELRLKQTKKNLADAVITSPISGQVVNVNSELGEFVSPQAPLFTVVTLNPITLSAKLSANQMQKFLNETEANVLIPDLNQIVQAEITYLSPVTDQTGFYPIEARVANDDLTIKPGMITKFQLEEQLVQDQLLVPTAAIVEKSGSSYVYQIVDGRAVQKEVAIVETQSELTAVKGELSEDDMIVVRGQTTLTDGSKVKLIEGAQ